MTQVIAVSKQGEDVLTATNPNDFIFHSSYNSFKIIAEGIFTQVVPSGTIATYGFSHGLTYTPMVIAFCKVDGLTTAVNSYEGIDIDIFPHYLFFHNVSSDAININFKVENDDVVSHTFNFKYYIFEAPF